MEVNGLLERYADTCFCPNGKDETGAFMIIEDCVIHVRNDDLAITEGQALKEIWPLIDRVQRV